jgi:hypothetical protein
MQPGLYQHYRGNYYRVLGMARHEETLEALVIYQQLYGDYGLWARPKDVFEEDVMVDQQKRPRFKFIRPLFHELPEIKL